ncbi:hypothetical protein [Chelativorans sp. J32]|uniref:hypothetical protein n=1 Tax=Chelativorans sp. J32 TaxID=935840 RepID=UPI0004B120C9|nr:hypothetical protein [Chelativorans sp. J32]
MPTTPHPDDPAEGSREVVDRQLKQEKTKEDAGASPKPQTGEEHENRSGEGKQDKRP